jgi:hypothetical protein
MLQLRKLGRIMNNELERASEDSVCPDRDSNPELPENKSGGLPLDHAHRYAKSFFKKHITV